MSNFSGPYSLITNGGGSVSVTAAGNAQVTGSITVLGAGGIILGTGDAGATPAGTILRAPNAAGANIAGATMTIAGGTSTGTGAVGPIAFQASIASTVAGAGVNAATEIARFTGSSVLAAGTVNLFNLAGVVNQSATAGYVGLRVSITETATGSGTKSLLDVLGGVAGTTSIFSVNNAGQAILPVSGSTAGLLIGGDTNLYRNSANFIRTDDTFWPVNITIGSGGGGLGSAIYVDSTLAGSGPNQYGLSFNCTYSSVGTGNQFGVLSQILSGGSGVFATVNMAAYYAGTNVRGGTQTLTNNSGMWIDAQTATCTTAYGLRIGAVSGGSGNNYGLHVTAPTGTGAIGAYISGGLSVLGLGTAPIADVTNTGGMIRITAGSNAGANDTTVDLTYYRTSTLLGAFGYDGDVTTVVAGRTKVVGDMRTVNGTGFILLTSTGDLFVTGIINAGGGLRSNGDPAGVAATVGYSNVTDTTANNVGIGTILFKGPSSRNSSGFLKILDGVTARYIPFFDAITG